MKQKRNLWITAIVVIIFLVLGTAGYCTSKALSPAGRRTAKQAVLVEVKQGDSLWTIARSYYSEEFKNIRRYIAEIKEANGLKDNTIHYGRHLIIPCYESGPAMDRNL